MKKEKALTILKNSFAKLLAGLIVLQSFVLAVPAASAAVKNIPVGTFPYAIAVTPDGAKVYATNSNSNDVSVISTATDTVIATISVGANPDSIAVTPDGAKVYVGNAGSDDVSVISTVTDTVIATVPVGDHPQQSAITPDGSKVYVTDTNSGDVSVISTTTDSVTTTIPVGFLPSFVAITPDGTKAYLTNAGDNTISVISTSSDTVTTTILAGATPFYTVFTPDGTKAYVTNLSFNNVSSIDVGTDTITSTFFTGQMTYALAVTPDGTKVFGTNNVGNDVTVINTNSDTVPTTIPVDAGPAFIVITPDGSKVYTTNSTGDTVSVFGTDYVPPSATPYTTDNTVTLSREAVNAPATATISFTLADTLSTPLTLAFDSAFTGLDATGATAFTPDTPGCMTNFQNVDGHTFKADKFGCSGPVVISGVTVVNPPTPGPYLVSWYNDDPGYAMVAIVDSDQVTVNANVSPTITFDLDSGIAAGETAAPYSVALGALSTGAVNHSDNAAINSIFAQLDTNATSGAQVTVLSANAALKSTSVPADTIPNAAAPMAAGTANYGICVNTVTPPTQSTGTFQTSAPYSAVTCDPAGDTNDVKTLSTVTPTDILDSANAPLTNGSAEILVNAAIDTSTAAHSDYADTLTFVATGTF